MQNQSINAAKQIMIRIIGTLGAIAVGLGLYRLYVAQGNAFSSFLNEPKNCWTLIATGVLAAGWVAWAFLQLKKQKQ